MKILYKYSLKEQIPMFITGILVFTFILMIDKVVNLLDLFLNKNVEFLVILKLIVYLMPSIVALTIPMSLLLASLLAFSRLASDSEIIAMRSGGVNISKLIIPGIFFGIMLTISMIIFNDRVLPYANFEFKKTYFNIVKKHSNIAFQPRIFINDFDNFSIYFNDIEHKKKIFKDVYIFDRRNNANPKLITAKTGKIVSKKSKHQVLLKLSDGNIINNDPKKENRMHIIQFNEYYIYLDIHQTLYNQQPGKSTRELNLKQLKSMIENTKTVERKNFIKTEYYIRFSIPFAAIVFILLGSPLGMMFKKSNKGIGFAISIIIFFIYYLLLIMGQSFGSKGIMNPVIAIWFPNILIIIPGIIFSLHIKKL